MLLLLVEIGFPASDYVGKRVFSPDEQPLPVQSSAALSVRVLALLIVHIDY